jgi:transcriptional regulator with XRE-family HTH domain
MKHYNVQETAMRIRGLRKIYGFTQENAAKMLEIDRRSLSHIETGSKGCSIDLLVRFATIYHVSLDYLLLGKKQDDELLKAKLDTAITQLIELRNIL